MSDGWTNRKGRTLLNFLVRCPKGTVFIKAVDALAYIKDVAMICALLDGFSREIGVQNMVQFTTDNAANYVVVGRMLMERHHTLFWTPCATHCIGLLLEDMRKLSFIKEVIDMARSIPKFIYNHAFVLGLVRRYTKNKELQRPEITFFDTKFITLQSFLRCQFELNQMFVSDESCDLRYKKSLDGRAIEKLVHTDSFWK